MREKRKISTEQNKITKQKTAEKDLKNYIESRF
jgi:hypothetical protein